MHRLTGTVDFAGEQPILTLLSHLYSNSNAVATATRHSSSSSTISTLPVVTVDSAATGRGVPTVLPLHAVRDTLSSPRDDSVVPGPQCRDGLARVRCRVLRLGLHSPVYGGLESKWQWQWER